MLAWMNDLIARATSSIQSKETWHRIVTTYAQLICHPRIRRFLDSHMTTSNTQVKRVALFGTGRAGSIHLANIVANPRIKLAYIVESDSSSWEACRTKWNLTASKTTFIHPDNVAEVYKDSTVDACIICTPTFTHEMFIIGSLQWVCCFRTNNIPVLKYKYFIGVEKTFFARSLSPSLTRVLPSAMIWQKKRAELSSVDFRGDLTPLFVQSLIKSVLALLAMPISSKAPAGIANCHPSLTWRSSFWNLIRDILSMYQMTTLPDLGRYIPWHGVPWHWHCNMGSRWIPDRSVFCGKIECRWDFCHRWLRQCHHHNEIPIRCWT